MARFALKNVLFTSLVILCLFAGKGQTRPAEGEDDDKEYFNDEYGDGDENYPDSGEKEEDEVYNGPPPVIHSAPLNITVQPGETVFLPCDVDEVAYRFAVLWEKGTHTLFTDTYKQVKDVRFERFSNNTIRIVNARDSDSSSYTCKISTTPIVEIVHHVHVPTPPEIIEMKPLPDHERKKMLKKGESLTLECKATGYPKPEIQWIRKNKKMPSGQEVVIGTSVTFDSVRRHHDGIYQCTASNGLGKPVQRSIEIHVQYAPEISIEKETVNTAEGFESELICTVHAEPKAVVEWMHNGKPVMISDNTDVTRESGGKHILRLKNTKKEDFGSYMCKASNALGSNQKVAKLSGLPNRPMFVSESANDKMGEVFEWTVESSSPITEYKLEYRKTEEKTEWMLVESPVVENPEGNKYTVKHTFSLPAGKYETVLRAKNTYGWSEPSLPHKFSIESSTGGAEDIRPRIFAIVTILSIVTHFL